jgi:hypothetical protein
MTTAATGVRSKLHEFFYAQETPYSLAAMRIILPLVMLTMVASRWQFAREIYSTDGATAPLAIGYGYYNLLPEFSGTVAVALCSLLLVAMFTACIGWCTRISLTICFVLYTYLSLIDAVSTMTKYSVIVTHLLLLLSCSDCGAIWSVDAWLARRKGDEDAALPVAPVWPRRLVQLLIGIIYFGAAITKINTPEFLTGDQLNFWMLTHINYRHPVGEWLSMYPVLVRASCYTVVVWEMTFIFLVWKPSWRPWVLAIGVMFHFMTVLTLGLMIFPMVCFICYLAYVDERDARQAAAACGRLWQRYGEPAASANGLWARLVAAWQSLAASLPQPGRLHAWRHTAAMGFAAFTILTTVGGVGLEHWLDLYGERRPEGRYQLKPIDPDLARRMVAPPQPIRDVDKFFSIDTGTILVGDLLADRRRVFHHGQKLIAQCNLIPPHEDMWIECKIKDADNRLVDRMGNVVLREHFRANFMYPITAALEPGAYTLVFETAGREVLRKRIQIVGDVQTAAAAN